MDVELEAVLAEGVGEERGGVGSGEGHTHLQGGV